MPGIYSEEQFNNLKLQDDRVTHTDEDVKYLDPMLIAEIVVKELLDPKATDPREYVKRIEWNIYEDFAQVRNSEIKPPSLYTSFNF